MLGAPKSDCRGGSTDGAARDGRMRLRPFFIGGGGGVENFLRKLRKTFDKVWNVTILIGERGEESLSFCVDRGTETGVAKLRKKDGERVPLLPHKGV